MTIWLDKSNDESLSLDIRQKAGRTHAEAEFNRLVRENDRRFFELRHPNLTDWLCSQEDRFLADLGAEAKAFGRLSDAQLYRAKQAYDRRPKGE